MSRLILSVWLFALLTTVEAIARPPLDASGDRELKQWFESLRQPGTRQPCCSISDCRFVSFSIRDGHYKVVIDGFTYTVPRAVVVPGIPNPTGKAVACYTYSEFKLPPAPGVIDGGPQDVAEILCFVPPRPPS